MIRASGHTPAETVVNKTVRAPAPDERELLGLADGDQVIDVERVRYADRRPVIYSRDRIPATLLGEISGRAPGQLAVRDPRPRRTPRRRLPRRS